MRGGVGVNKNSKRKSDTLGLDDLLVIGAPRRLYSVTVDNVECEASILAHAQRVVDKRECLLILGNKEGLGIKLGFSILRAMLDTPNYLDINGDLNPLLVRFIGADDFVRRLSAADFGERRAMWNNLFEAYDDGSGWVRSIMIAGLGDEYGKDAVNHIKYIINKCNSDMVQLIVETSLGLDKLVERYGERIGWLLSSGKIIKLNSNDLE